MSDRNGSGPAHEWIIQGLWHVTDEQIKEAYDEGRGMTLQVPDEVHGPGCRVCQRHWFDARGTACPGAQWD